MKSKGKLRKETDTDEEADESADKNSTSNETANSTANESSSANETDDNSVSNVLPYWRATREKKASKDKKPYEPRPAKYKENYEDKGLKVFKPDFEAVGTVTSDTYKKLGPEFAD